MAKRCGVAMGPYARTIGHDEHEMPVILHGFPCGPEERRLAGEFEPVHHHDDIETEVVERQVVRTGHAVASLPRQIPLGGGGACHLRVESCRSDPSRVIDLRPSLKEGCREAKTQNASAHGVGKKREGSISEQIRGQGAPACRVKCGGVGRGAWFTTRQHEWKLEYDSGLRKHAAPQKGEKRMLDIRRIPVLSDNYAWLLHDTERDVTAVVDPGEAGPIEAVIGDGALDMILLTHHHTDHVGGTDELRARYGARVIGAASERRRLPVLDEGVSDGDTVMVGAERANVIATPGHADGHVSYFFSSVPALFCGDTLFSMGCGRLLEGSAEQLYASLRRFDGLPDATLVCCGHEYTLSNAKFAVHADPDNVALQTRLHEVGKLRAKGEATIPVKLGTERATNPFLRATDVRTFAALRKEKDSFR